MALLFTVGPALLALGPRWLVTVGILASGVICAVALAIDPTFPRGDLVGATGVRPNLRLVLARTLAVWAGLLAATLIAAPRSLFHFPRTRPIVWLMVMFLYPLSAYAQEIVFRAFSFSPLRRIVLRSIEHALYGDFVFSIGLGSLFYSSARWLTAIAR